jgi:hypothetical protein
VSEAALDETIKVGAVLANGARRAARHWPLGLVGIVAMAGMLLLLLDLAGQCFPPGGPACIYPTFFAALKTQRSAVTGDLLIIAPLLGAFVVVLVMVRLFYLGENPDARVRSIGLRPAWFAGRQALGWTIVSAAPLSIDIGYRHAAWALYPEYAGPAMLWLGYIALKVVGLAVASYFHAGLVLYLPSVVYQAEPERLPALWTRTHPVRWKLFFVFFPIDVGTTVLQTVFIMLAQHVIDLTMVAQGLADWSKVDAQYVTALLPPAIIYLVIVPVVGLLDAAISVVAYRALVTIDHTRAGVFD